MSRTLTLRELAGELRRLGRETVPRFGLELHRESHRDFARRIPPRIPRGATGGARRGFDPGSPPAQLGATSSLGWSATDPRGFDYAVLVLEPGRRKRKGRRGRRGRAGAEIGSRQAPKGVFRPAIDQFRRARFRRIADREFRRLR